MAHDSSVAGSRLSDNPAAKPSTRLTSKRPFQTSTLEGLQDAPSAESASLYLDAMTLDCQLPSSMLVALAEILAAEIPDLSPRDRAEVEAVVAKAEATQPEALARARTIFRPEVRA